LQQLTKDHSLVQQQLDEGLISLKESKHHPLQNVILRAVGIEENIAVDIVRGKVQAGDQFLLCSDGLSDMVPASDIGQTLQTATQPQTKVERLIELANNSGGKDNITVVLVTV
jgi:protein phosphatase